MRSFLVLLLVMAQFACKTGGEEPQAPGSLVFDFDDGADTSRIELARDYQFCPKSSNFNIINAYWLGAASAYTYATRQTITDVTAAIREKWKGQVEFFSNDEQSAVQHHSQAMWIEFPDFAILSFRGTQLSVQDWTTDFRFIALGFDAAHPEKGSVHRGFRDALDVIWPEVKAKIQTLNGKEKPLFITGHSLGGALATMTTARILLQDDLQAVKEKNLRGLYTYGSPRIGDETFAQHFKNAAMTVPGFHIARFRNHADLVTRVPSSRLFVGYEHLGPLFYFDEPGRLYSSTTNVNFRRLFMPGDVQTGMIEDIGDYRFRNFTTKYSDHSMLKYITKMDNEYKLSLEWTKEHGRDDCDMGMFAVAWKFDPNPPEAKPYTSNLPVATAREENGRTVKDCCWCYRTWYHSTWGRDPAFKQENFVGVIQEGEIASGNCMYPGGEPQGHLWWQGTSTASNGRTYDQYYTYSACEGVTLVGDACVTGQEIVKDGVPTGRVIKKDAWVP